MRRYEGIWTKRQMLPIWIMQIIALGVFAVAACLLLAAAHYIERDGGNYYGYSSEELARYAQ
jgi:spermidine/putrescine-binding protein